MQRLLGCSLLIVLGLATGCPKTSESPPEQPPESQSTEPVTPSRPADPPQPESVPPALPAPSAESETQPEAASERRNPVEAAETQGVPAERPPAGETPAPASSQPGKPAAAEGAAAGSLSRAKQLRSRSLRKAEQGDSRGAFQDARDAWQLVREEPDAACQGLAAELYADLQQLSGKLAPAGRVDDSRPLILK